jgi:hypothetical protein
MSSSVAGWSLMCPVATASRREAGLADMSTMLALPCSSVCVSAMMALSCGQFRGDSTPLLTCVPGGIPRGGFQASGPLTAENGRDDFQLVADSANHAASEFNPEN